jgi:hypothetical protein
MTGLPATAARRVIDVTVSVVILVVLVPLFVFFAILTCATSSGPAFYLQRRTGKNGKPFRLISFRTIEHGQGGGITPIGRFMRRSSIDRLPSLLNVLVGDMSFVGPPPSPPGHLIPSEKPGLVPGDEAENSASDFEELTQRPVIHDLKIMGKAAWGFLVSRPHGNKDDPKL